MKKILGLLVIVVSFGASFGYQLTDVDQRIVDGFVEKVNEVYDEKWDIVYHAVRATILELAESTDNERYEAIFRAVYVETTVEFTEDDFDALINILNDSVGSGYVFVENGDRVKVNYVWYFKDGDVFDTNIVSVARDHWIYQEARNYEPLSFEVWAKQMIEWFEEWIIGMRVGGWMKSLIIPPEKGYGEWTQDALVEVTRDQIVAQDYEVWDEIDGPHGEKIPVYDIQWDVVTLDFNHPMAGKTIYFDVEVVEIVE